jgi:hypothetical protein
MQPRRLRLGVLAVTYEEEPYEREWWTHRADVCTCGAWRMPYRWCDDGCAFITPGPSTFCQCGHAIEDHDLDDGCGGCAMAMTGPCRNFRPKREEQV